MENGFLNPGKARVGCLHCSLGIHFQEEFLKGSFDDAMPWIPMSDSESNPLAWVVYNTLTGHILEGPFKVVDGE